LEKKFIYCRIAHLHSVQVCYATLYEFFVFKHIYVCTCVYMHTCVCTYICVCIYMWIYIYISICVRTYVYTCMYTYTYMDIYNIYMCKFIYIHTLLFVFLFIWGGYDDRSLLQKSPIKETMFCKRDTYASICISRYIYIYTYIQI